MELIYFTTSSPEPNISEGCVKGRILKVREFGLPWWLNGKESTCQ